MELETILSEFTVDAFYERILSRLPWLDKVQFDYGTRRPEEHCHTRELARGRCPGRCEWEGVAAPQGNPFLLAQV
ncbi:MAG: hypothetical protein AB8B57_06515 [Congregibacter sp.]